MLFDNSLLYMSMYGSRKASLDDLSCMAVGVFVNGDEPLAHFTLYSNGSSFYLHWVLGVVIAAATLVEVLLEYGRGVLYVYFLPVDEPLFDEPLYERYLSDFLFVKYATLLG